MGVVVDVIAEATEVDVGEGGIEVGTAAGVDGTGDVAVTVPPIFAVGAGVGLAAFWASWGVCEDVPEQAANITAHSRASPIHRILVA